MKVQKRDIFWNCLLFFLYSFSLFVIGYLNTHCTSLVILGIPFTIMSVNGCLSVIQLCIISLFCVLSKGKTFFLSVFFQTLNITLNAVSVLRSSNFQSSPGIMMALLGIVLLVILNSYLKQLKMDEIALDTVSYTDSLTNCLNRRGFMRELEVKASIGKNFYVVLLDIDNFAQINNKLGFKVGDKILIELADFYLSLNLPCVQIVARVGADEFALILEDNFIQDEHFALLVNLASLQEKYNDTLKISAGVVHFSRDTTDVEQLFFYADIALRSAKARRSGFAYFNKEFYKEIASQYLTEEDIKDALKKNTFELKYQPQYTTANKELFGFETLIRMKNKQNEYVNTQNFIDIAERSDLIFDIDCWVIKNAMIQMKPLIEKNNKIKLAVNVSGKNISSLPFIDYLRKCLNDTGFNPSNLKIEITETAVINNFDDLVVIISELIKMGITIALDDFGTGYSSLSYLSRISADLLKIDKSFVDEIEKNRELVKIMILLGHLTHSKVIAEGVETEQQVEILRELGCDFIQGYIWGRPMSLEQIKPLV